MNPLKQDLYDYLIRQIRFAKSTQNETTDKCTKYYYEGYELAARHFIAKLESLTKEI